MEHRESSVIHHCDCRMRTIQGIMYVISLTVCFSRKVRRRVISPALRLFVLLYLWLVAMIRSIKLCRQHDADRSRLYLHEGRIPMLGEAKSRKKTYLLIRPRSMRGLRSLVLHLIQHGSFKRPLSARWASFSSMGPSMKRDFS